MSGLAPKLRFPSFKDNWQVAALKKLAKIYDGTHQTPNYVENGVPFYSVEHLTSDNFTNTKFITEEVYQNELKRVSIEKYDVLMTRIGDIGTSKVIDWDVRASFYVSLALFKFDKDKSISSFMHYLISSDAVQKELYKRTIHVAFPKKINLGEIGECFGYIPSLPEQQKIADFLSSVDAKIDAVKRKQDAYERYKKGLMQQIFAQKIRFKQDDGSDFPEWEEKRLGDVYSWINTNSLSREHLTYEINEIQNIHYGDIHTKYKTMFHQEKEAVPYILPLAPMRKISNEEFCEIGDVVIADASEDYKDIGKSIEVLSVRKNSLVAGLHTYIARPNKSMIAIGFSGYLFANYQTRKQIMRIAQGISVLGISKTNMAELKLNIPTLPEQQKIADFLSAVDSKIDATKAQIEKLEAFKKGLLQQMFV